jgi:organic hydroperoxide reductase OsmC/OhrA
MSEHRITLTWNAGAAPFSYETYPREHTIAYKNGQQVMATSAAPAFRGNGIHADPEDLLVAALSSCHMLSFLAIAAKKRLTVKSYQDDAVGVLVKDGGKYWIPKVILRPKIECDIDPATLDEMHHMAHEQCFIANSVKTEVVTEPR